MLETLNPRKRVRVWNPATQQYEENVSPERGGLMADTAAYMDQTKATEGRIADIWAGDRQREQLHQDTLRGRNLLVNAPTAGEIDRAGTVLAEGEAATQRGINAANPTAAGRRAKDRELAAARNLNPWRADAPYQPPPVPTGGLMYETRNAFAQPAPAGGGQGGAWEPERMKSIVSENAKAAQATPHLREAERLEAQANAGDPNSAGYFMERDKLLQQAAKHRQVAHILQTNATVPPELMPTYQKFSAFARDTGAVRMNREGGPGTYVGGLTRTPEEKAAMGLYVPAPVLYRNAGEKATRETGLAKTEAEGAIAKGQAGLIGSAAAVAAQGAALGPEGRAKLAGAGGAGMAMDETIDLAMRQRAADQQANKGNPNAQIPPLEEYVDRMKRIRTGQPPPAPAPAQPGVLMGLAQAAGKGMLQTLFPREAGVVWPQGKPNIAPRGQPSPLPVPPVSSAPPGMAPQPQRLPTLGGPAATPGGAVGRLFGAGAPRAPAPQVAAPVAQAAPVSGSKTVGEVLGPQAGPWAGKPITEFTAALRANPRDPALRQLAQALRAAGY
jgi:hypothetical protein